jgi:hypothetical protein
MIWASVIVSFDKNACQIAGLQRLREGLAIRRDFAINPASFRYLPDLDENRNFAFTLDNPLCGSDK